MANITLGEDDENIVTSVSLARESHGHAVKAFYDGAAGLASDLTGLERDGVGAIGEGFLDCGRQGVFLFRLMQRTTTACGGPPERAARHHGRTMPTRIANRATQMAKSRRGRRGTHRLCWLTSP